MILHFCIIDLVMKGMIKSLIGCSNKTSGNTLRVGDVALTHNVTA